MNVDRRALLARSLGLRPTQATSEVGPADRRRYAARLRELEGSEPLSALDLRRLLREHGISRRTFMKWVSATTALLALPPSFEPMVARATEALNRIPIIWAEGQSCRGNSEAFLRSDAPTVEELLFQTISLEFHQLLMAAAGFQAEERKAEAVSQNKGKYVLVVEGSIPTGYEGAYSANGPNLTPFVDEIKQLAADAAMVIAVGACATSASLPAANPNPTGALSTEEVVKGKPIVNIQACPINPINFVGTLIHFTLTGQVPPLDSLLRPKWAFGALIHDNCERRAHFDAGEYVEEWGDAGAKAGFCLYKMGCKGPMTHNNCPTVLYNARTSWPVESGHGCIGCSEPDFWDKYAFERPISNADVKVPGLFGLGVEGSVDEFGLGLLSAVGAGIAAHAIATGVAHVRTGRHAGAGAARRGGAPGEESGAGAEAPAVRQPGEQTAQPPAGGADDGGNARGRGPDAQGPSDRPGLDRSDEPGPGQEGAQ